MDRKREREMRLRCVQSASGDFEDDIVCVCVGFMYAKEGSYGIVPPLSHGSRFDPWETSCSSLMVVMSRD